MAALAEAVKRRILTIDLERLPGLAPVWDQRTDFIPARKWRRFPSTLCWSARWYGQSRIMFAGAWDGHEVMVQKMWDLYDAADIVITYNGKRADNLWAQGDWLKYGMPTPRPWKDIDLFVAGKKFGYPSRSLEHLCVQLGIDGKLGHYDDEVAEAAANGHRLSQRELRRYNGGDVDASERVYERLRPWITGHPHVNIASSELTCPRCGSKNLDRLPTDYLAVQIEYAQYRCAACSGLVRAAHTRRIANTRPV